jgi:hypothetical protein
MLEFLIDPPERVRLLKKRMRGLVRRGKQDDALCVPRDSAIGGLQLRDDAAPDIAGGACDKDVDHAAQPPRWPSDIVERVSGSAIRQLEQSPRFKVRKKTTPRWVKKVRWTCCWMNISIKIEIHISQWGKAAPEILRKRRPILIYNDFRVDGNARWSQLAPLFDERSEQKKAGQSLTWLMGDDCSRVETAHLLRDGRRNIDVFHGCTAG